MIDQQITSNSLIDEIRKLDNKVKTLNNKYNYIFKCLNEKAEQISNGEDVFIKYNKTKFQANLYCFGGILSFIALILTPIPATIPILGFLSLASAFGFAKKENARRYYKTKVNEMLELMKTYDENQFEYKTLKNEYYNEYNRLEKKVKNYLKVQKLLTSIKSNNKEKNIISQHEKDKETNMCK